MIRIEVSNTNLDLSPSTQIEWVRTNPLFLDDVDLQADRSFNFKVPRSTANDKLLKGQKLISGCRLIVNGKLFANTKLHVLGDDKSNYDISLVQELLKVDKSVKLPELEWEEVDTSTGVFSIKDNANTTDSDFVFPWIQNDDGSAFQALHTIYNLLTPASFINEKALNTLSQRQDVLNPQFRLNAILDEVCKQLFALEYSGSIRSKLTEYIIYNTTVLNKLFAFTFKVERANNTLTFTIPSRDEFDIGIGDIMRIGIYALNASSALQFKLITYTVVAGDIDTDGKVHVLNFFNNFIAAIQSFALQTPNLMMEETADEPYFSFSPGSHQDSENPTYVYLSKTVANAVSNISAKNHLPNITAIEFIQSIKDFFCLSIIPNYTEQKLYFVHRRTLLYTNRYKDYTSKLLDYYTNKIDEQKNIRFVFSNDSSDAWTKDDSVYRFHANNYPEHNANGYEEFSISCATTAVILKEIGVPVTELTIPLTSQAIHDVASNTGDFSLRLLKWQGSQIFPLLPDAVPLADDEDLDPNSAYNAWWKDWYNFFKSGVKTTTFDMLLTANDILGLDPELKWKIKHHHYLWSEIRTTISMMHGIEVSKVPAVKVEYAADCNPGSDATTTGSQTIGDE